MRFKRQRNKSENIEKNFKKYPQYLEDIQEAFINQEQATIKREQMKN